MSSGVILTHHSKRRSKQRAGITRNQLTMMAKRAYSDGIKHSEARGSLRSWMDGEYLKYKTANNCRFYANQMYIFHNSTLITVLDAPMVYEKELFNYVSSIKVYITYRRNRIKHKRNFYDLCKDLADELDETLKKDITRYLNQHSVNKERIKYTYGQIIGGNFQVIIYFEGKRTEDELEIYIPQINRYIKKKYGLDTQYRKRKTMEI